MKDAIHFPAMRLPCRVGALPGENDQPQALGLTLRIGVDLEAAGRSDRLSDTVDYGNIFQALQSVLEAGPYILLEAVAHRCIGSLFDLDERVMEIEIEVVKLHPPLGDAAGPIAVSLRRSRSQ